MGRLRCRLREKKERLVAQCSLWDRRYALAYLAVVPQSQKYHVGVTKRVVQIPSSFEIRNNPSATQNDSARDSLGFEILSVQEIY